MAKDGEFLKLIHTRSLAATDLQYQALWSSNLATWSSAGITDQFISTQATYQTCEAKVPLVNMDPARGFIRPQVK